MPRPSGSERDLRASHSSRFRPDFDTFIKKKRQQLNARRPRGRGRFPRNRGFSSRKPHGGPFHKGTRFPFKPRSRSPSGGNKFFTRRSRSRSSSQSKYNSRKSRSRSSDKCNFSTSRIDSRSSSFEGSFNKLNNLQVERSCSPRESLRITIDNDRCESADSQLFQADYTMNQNWNDRRSRRNEDPRRSRSGSNYSNSPDNRNRRSQNNEPAPSIFTQKHLSGRDMQNFDDDVHASAIAMKATPKPSYLASSSSLSSRNENKGGLAQSIFTPKHLSGRDMQNFDDDVHASAIAVKANPKPSYLASSSSLSSRNENKGGLAQSIFTPKHLSGRDMQNFDDDVHASAIAVKAPPKPVSITSSSSLSSFSRNENKRHNVDDNSNSRYRKRPSESIESFTGTSSSSNFAFQSSNRELETIVAITEGSNYNTSAFTAPREEKTLFHCQEVKPSRVKGTLNIGIIPSKKVKLENAPALIPGLDLEPDDVDEYLYGSEGSNDSQSKSATLNISTNVVVEPTPSRVSALDPRLRRSSASFSPASDLHQTVPMPPTQETAVAVYHSFDTQEPSAQYNPNAAQASISSMELQLPVPTFGGMIKPRRTNSFNANNLKQITIATSEVLASHNDQNASNGGGNTVSSQAQSNDSSCGGEAKIRTQADKDNALFIIDNLGNKLKKCKSKLEELKNEQLKLLAINKRRKDGLIDPKYTDNCNLQSEMNKKIHEFECKIESFRRKIKEYEKEKSSEGPGKPIQIKALTEKVGLSRSKSRNESPVEKSKSSQVAYQYVDFRNHFCTHCQEVIPSVDEFLNHLHSKHIDVVNNMGESDRPWTIKSRDNKIQNAAKVYAAPIKGVEFMLPCTGFYCKLCKELFGDSASAKVHLESYAHNKNQAIFCKANANYEAKISLQKNSKLNREKGFSIEKVSTAPHLNKNDNDTKQATSSKSSSIKSINKEVSVATNIPENAIDTKPAASSKSLSTKIINKEVSVAKNIPENNPIENEGSHTITKPGAKIPIKLKDKGVSNNVILAEAATKAEELRAIKQAESEASKTSPAKYSFKPVQFKKPLLRGPPPPLEEFITIGQSSSPSLPEELASPTPLKLQPNIKPNLPVKIKPEPRDTGYDKYVNSDVGAQDQDNVASGAATKGPQSPTLSPQNIESDSMPNLNTENIKSEPEEGNDLNIRIVSVQSLNSENGAENLFAAPENANLQESEECDPKNNNEEDDWDRATLPDEDQMDLLDEDLRYHENDQAISLTSNDVRFKIENFATDDPEKS